jgi:aminopeptidase N
MKLVLVLALCIALPALAQRLPQNATPTHYALHITPDIAAKTFRGEEAVDITLAQASKTVTMNALELNILSATATHISASGQAAAGDSTPDILNAAISFDGEKQQVTFTFSHALPAGATRMHIAFSGMLGDKLRGFYLSQSQTTAQSQPRSYAVTQFESTEARRAFPCFDEPALKATFDISLTVDKDDTAISNGNEISDHRQGDKRTFVFATTPKMSTYLVAFLVGDFKCEKGKSDGTPIRVCATPEKVKLTKFALTTAEQALHYYNSYFGIAYPMPKLDLIAIPDFEEGAMENFGAITFRESGLLVPPGASESTKKQVSYFVTHEMAHQWFGDMVTMRWWNDLWLNEGFATWMEAKATARLHPEWDVAEDQAQQMDDAMGEDALDSTRPIRAQAETPAQITQMFDDIAYSKAAAVIGMIENWLGEETFRQGVHSYLAAHLYANATAEDFWNAQQQTSHQPVARVMSSLIELPGVPLLWANDAVEKSVVLTQSKYFANPPLVEDEARRLWAVPVCLKLGTAQQCSVLDALAGKVAAPPNAAVFLNARDKAYFRTAYTSQQTSDLQAAAETQLSAPERIGFFGDVWAMVVSGAAPVGQYLDLVLALRQDTNADVQETALGKLGFVTEDIATAPQAEQLHALLRAKYTPIYAALPAAQKSDAESVRQLRGVLFALLGRSGDAAVIDRAHAMTQALFNGKDATDDGTLDAAVDLTSKDGTPEFFAYLQRVALHAQDPNLQQEALHLLAHFEDEALTVKTLEFATSATVRNQDSSMLIAAELAEPVNRAVAWTWVKAHWAQVAPHLTESSGAELVAATGGFCTVALRDDARMFFAAHPVEAADRALAQAQARSGDCIHTRAVQQPKLEHWLASQPVGSQPLGSQPLGSQPRWNDPVR